MRQECGRGRSVDAAGGVDAFPPRAPPHPRVSGGGGRPRPAASPPHHPRRRARPAARDEKSGESSTRPPATDWEGFPEKERTHWKK
eukprot:gene10145-3599_t